MIRFSRRTSAIPLLLAALPAQPSCTGPRTSRLGPMEPSNARRHDKAIEATSLLGAPLHAKTSGPDLEKLEANLAAAQRDLAAHPDDPAKVVWVGRRLGYLWRMNDAVDVFTRGIAQHPGYAPLWRHRGHRYISLRRFDDAIRDLEKAAELIEGRPDEMEPDGAPNVLNIPLTTTRFNVWYHLGLARYLKGDFDGALAAYRECMKASWRYDDNLVATGHWMYMTLRRLGRPAEAAKVLDLISTDMDVVEDKAYHQLLMMYKSGRDPLETIVLDAAGEQDFATLGYGIGNWYFYNNQPDRAREIFQHVIARSPWTAFGHIAAEAELAR